MPTSLDNASTSSSVKSQPLHDLSQFGLRDITIATAAIRKIGDGATTFEAVAERIVRYLYTSCTDSTLSQPACTLVRLFRTQPFHLLDKERKRIARHLSNGDKPTQGTRCLCLAASIGQHPEWNHPTYSQGHKVIPLKRRSMIEKSPMIGHMLKQFGAMQDILCSRPSTILLDSYDRSYQVFFVQEAPGSPYVPAQENFVLKYGVRSVFGFGSPMPSGQLFAVILFSKIAMTREIVEGFRPIALAAKLALLPFDTFQHKRPPIR